MISSTQVNDPRVLSGKTSRESTLLTKVVVESDPTKLECRDKRRLYSSLGIETTLDVDRSDCEGGS